jgi:ABC-2 type transport system permease protein
MTLQSILASNYKWWYQYKTTFKSATAYRWSNISFLIGRFITLGFTVIVWKLNIDAGSNLFTFQQIFTYYVIGSIFFVENGVHYGVSNAIKSGYLSTRMLYPSNTLFGYFMRDIGYHAFTDIIERVLFVGTAILGFQYLIMPSLDNIFLFLIMVILAYIMRVYYYYILGFVAFFIVDIFGVVDTQGALVGFLSGKVLPLTSAAFLLVLTYSPFAYFYHHPMQVYLGGYNLVQSVQVIIFGLVWILALHMLMLKLWKYGLKKYESVGL